MVEIKEVKTVDDRKKFINFQLDLYKNCKCFVPPLIINEKKIFGKKNSSYDDVDMIYFLALKDGKVVGRIGGVIQKAYNKKNNAKRVRFIKFDLENDQEVANALLGAVENWAKEKGMTQAHGPLGFNDLEREGMLVEGFDEIVTYEQNYNYQYYQTLIENYGYKKEVDWISRKIFTPLNVSERLERLASISLKRYKLHVVKLPKNKFIKKYQNSIFDCIDDAYGSLYGVTPLTTKVRKQIAFEFKNFLDMDLFIAVANQDEEIIAFGFAIPSLAQAIQKANGRLLPLRFVKIISAIKHYSTLDLCLIGIKKTWQDKGISAIIMRFLQQTMIDKKIEFCDTNLCLENNTKISQHWKLFETGSFKRFRCYVKNLTEEENGNDINRNKTNG